MAAAPHLDPTTPTHCRRRAAVSALGAALALALLAATPGRAQQPQEPIQITRIHGAITIDGDLSDAGWQEAAKTTTFWETNHGDNVEPPAATVAWLAYDDHFFYAAFEATDPDPSKIKAPLGDHDYVPGYTDYAGVIVNPTDDGKVAQMFLANARGIQYDAISNDATGEDNSPDFYWDSAGSITPTGWRLEMRIPFSSLRYQESNPKQWRILLYRNYPRDYRYQMFSSRLPRDSNCFICNSRPLVGLAGLPSGSHWVVAPFGTAHQGAEPKGGVLGNDLENDDFEGDIGVDAKWLPNPNLAIDATINPDFSQIESDVAQISANERFALNYPERRPFFLEGIDLFTTPIQAVYTRSFTNPDWGLRSTGHYGKNTFTALVGEDAGGGIVILPGPNGSNAAPQDFESIVATTRWRRDFGNPGSFISALYTGREIEGGGFNRVAGPDFRWAGDHDAVSGQFLYSKTETPNRPDLADEWNGQTLDGWAGMLRYSHQAKNWDFYGHLQSYDEDFRADNGFVPQVGWSEAYGEYGHTWWPKDKAVSRIRAFAFGWYDVDQDGDVISNTIAPGFGLDAKWNSFFRVEFHYGEILGIEKLHTRKQVRPYFEMRPGKVFSYFSLDARLGDEVDYSNDRLGDGINLNANADLRPTDHILLSLNARTRTLDVTAADGRRGELFQADAYRLKAVYTFNSRAWLRLIGQWQHVDYDPSLYTFAGVPDEQGSLGSSLTLAYKINWQTVAYLGYSDLQEMDERADLQPANRQVFLKVSYAFQR